MKNVMRIMDGVELCFINPKYGNINDKSINIVVTNRTIIKCLLSN